MNTNHIEKLWLVFGCADNPNNFFISYYPIHITTCFGLYRPSSCEINTVFFKSYYAFNGSVLGYTVQYFKFRILWNILQFKFKNQLCNFTGGWPVETKTCNDVKRRLWTKKLLRLMAHQKTNHSDGRNRMQHPKIKIIWKNVTIRSCSSCQVRMVLPVNCNSR
jgi:hypothetical protein